MTPVEKATRSLSNDPNMILSQSYVSQVGKKFISADFSPAKKKEIP